MRGHVPVPPNGTGTWEFLGRIVVKCCLNQQAISVGTIPNNQTCFFGTLGA